MFRKCPVCGLVWFRVEGCEQVTTCGARPEEKKKDDEVWDPRSLDYLVMFDEALLYELQQYLSDKPALTADQRKRGWYYGKRTVRTELFETP